MREEIKNCFFITIGVVVFFLVADYWCDNFYKIKDKHILIEQFEMQYEYYIPKYEI